MNKSKWDINCGYLRTSNRYSAIRNCNGTVSLSTCVGSWKPLKSLTNFRIVSNIKVSCICLFISLINLYNNEVPERNYLCSFWQFERRGKTIVTYIHTATFIYFRTWQTRKPSHCLRYFSFYLFCFQLNRPELMWSGCVKTLQHNFSLSSSHCPFISFFCSIIPTTTTNSNNEDRPGKKFTLYGI